MTSEAPLEPSKDEDAQQSIPVAWRSTLTAIVDALVEADFSLRRGIAGVSPVAASTIEQMSGYVTHYGETLAPLTAETWRTSVAMWMRGHWEILVDLQTVESGSSDLVLHAHVFETSEGYRYELHALYVP